MNSGRFSLCKVEDALASAKKKGCNIHRAAGTVWARNSGEASRAMALPFLRRVKFKSSYLSPPVTPFF